MADVQSTAIHYHVHHPWVDVHFGGDPLPMYINPWLIHEFTKAAHKQDDGAARRLFHWKAFQATTYEESEGKRVLRDEFVLLSSYLFCHGELFDDWTNRRLDLPSRLLAALRARFFLHIWRCHIVSMASKYPDLYSTSKSFISGPSFNILNRLCDTLVTLALVFSKYYPDVPFCLWLFGTEFVEHFFGIARTIMPNFTFTQFLSLVKHVMLRQRILLTGKFETKAERKNCSGYSFDFDASPLSPTELAQMRVRLTTSELDTLVELANAEAVSIAKDLLHMPCPSLPYKLSPLSGPARAKDVSDNAATQSDSDSDGDDADLEDSELETEEDDDKSNIEDASTTGTLSASIAEAAADAAREAVLVDADDELVAEAEGLDETTLALPTASKHPISPTQNSTPTSTSAILIDGHISVELLIKARRAHQGKANVKSGRTVLLDPKFDRTLTEAAQKLAGDSVPLNAPEKGASKGKEKSTPNDPKEFSLKEASHRTRLAQDRDADLRKPKTTRELNWQQAATRVVKLILPGELIADLPAKNVNGVHVLRLGSFIVVRNKTKAGSRTYIGEVLNILKKGVSSRHGSHAESDTAIGLSYLSLRVFLPMMQDHGFHRKKTKGMESDSESDDDSEDVPTFSCRDKPRRFGVHLYTHAKAAHFLYHLGYRNAVVAKTEDDTLHLTLTAGARWKALSRPKLVKALEEEMKAVKLAATGGTK